MIQLESFFRRQSGCLIFQYPPHKPCEIDDAEIVKIVKKRKVLLARYFTDSQLLPPQYLSSTISYDNEPQQWWHCVRDTPISLDSLNSKQRYRVKKGLKLNDIWIASPNELQSVRDELIEAIIASFSDYPSTYKPSITSDSFIHGLIKSASKPNQDIWLVRDRTNNTIIGYSYCIMMDGYVSLSAVKINPTYLNNEVNAALGFKICEHYINNLAFGYVSDGERNIRHITNYQDFLIRVLGFRKAYCKLHVIYHPWVKPIVNMLYPLRKMFFSIRNMHRFVYNISCILQQEEIVRLYRKRHSN